MLERLKALDKNIRVGIIGMGAIDFIGNSRTPFFATNLREFSRRGVKKIRANSCNSWQKTLFPIMSSETSSQTDESGLAGIVE